MIPSGRTHSSNTGVLIKTIRRSIYLDRFAAFSYVCIYNARIFAHVTVVWIVRQCENTPRKPMHCWNFWNSKSKAPPRRLSLTSFYRCRRIVDLFGAHTLPWLHKTSVERKTSCLLWYAADTILEDGRFCSFRSPSAHGEIANVDTARFWHRKSRVI